jgi:hypothetical protein
LEAVWAIPEAMVMDMDTEVALAAALAAVPVLPPPSAVLVEEYPLNVADG